MGALLDTRASAAARDGGSPAGGRGGERAALANGRAGERGALASERGALAGERGALASGRASERVVLANWPAGERAARAQLRRQIGRLERELAGLVAEGFGRVEVPYRVPAPAGPPRMLGLGELERTRDELAARVAEARGALAERAAAEGEKRRLLARMIAAPEDFKWVRIGRDELGLPGCGHWHSKPRLGPLGMLMGWWQVKVSSGCPLAGRLAAVERQAPGKAQAEAARRPSRPRRLRRATG